MACRSARVGDEIGGHNVSGHVHTTAEVVDIKETENNKQITFKVRHPIAWASNTPKPLLLSSEISHIDARNVASEFTRGGDILLSRDVNLGDGSSSKVSQRCPPPLFPMYTHTYIA